MSPLPPPPPLPRGRGCLCVHRAEAVCVPELDCPVEAAGQEEPRVTCVPNDTAMAVGSSGVGWGVEVVPSVVGVLTSRAPRLFGQ